MPVIRGPKHKLSRREGIDLFGNGGDSLQRRLTQPPGQHTPKPNKMQSEYGKQLREKQKVKRMYGMRENQFKRFFEQANRAKGMPGIELLVLLERRLDNVLYRLGFARTRLQSRQLVSHGHAYVDGQRVDIASFQIRPGMEISLDAVARHIPSVAEMIDSPAPVPQWLERRPAGTGRVLRYPERQEIDAHINERIIVEFYSR